MAKERNKEGRENERGKANREKKTDRRIGESLCESFHFSRLLCNALIFSYRPHALQTIIGKLSGYGAQGCHKKNDGRTSMGFFCILSDNHP